MLNLKPFVKWAGGKKQILPEIKKMYPFENKNINKYCEPFVGGGAVLFDILNNYKLKEIYISDKNKELINLYKAIQNNISDLLKYLKALENSYSSLSAEEKKVFYYKQRALFNELKTNNTKEVIQISALLLFLNKTCFNGLYRINKKGFFNVPIGSYKNPLICDKKNLLKINKALANVSINHADYKESMKFIDEQTFVYIDPPYKPLNKTSCFTSYNEFDFGDKEQKELAQFVNYIDKLGAIFIVSNSDPKNENINDDFFENIYKEFHIARIHAKRMINSKSFKRGNITELLISNF